MSSSSAAFQHSLGDGVVLVFIPVLRKVRAVLVPLKVGAHLIGNIRQIRIDGKVVFAVAVVDGTDALRLRFNPVQDADIGREPNKCGLPIYAFQNAFERLVRRDGVTALLAAHACNGVTEKCIASGYKQSDGVGILQRNSSFLSEDQNLRCRGLGLDALGGVITIGLQKIDGSFCSG